ncbi:hypothetical protein TURU_110105 [Turdus rufiventris]|nr:hypothetical protein TURU_110105 [Turdus rufiventris]
MRYRGEDTDMGRMRYRGEDAVPMEDADMGRMRYQWRVRYRGEDADMGRMRYRGEDAVTPECHSSGTQVMPMILQILLATTFCKYPDHKPPSVTAKCQGEH